MVFSAKKSTTYSPKKKTPYKPIISKERYDKIVGWLLEYALIHEYTILMDKIHKAHNGALSKCDNALLLRLYFKMILMSGPLPMITNVKFIYNLHRAFEIFLRSNHSHILTDLNVPDLANLVTAVRILVLKAFIKSDKYDQRDKMKMLDTLFKVDSNEEIGILSKESIGASLKDELNMKNKRARRHFEMVLNGEKPHKTDNESEVECWQKISPTVLQLINCIQTNSNVPVLDRLTKFRHQWLDYVITGIGNKSEDQLCTFFKMLKTLRIQSAFWLNYPL